MQEKLLHDILSQPTAPFRERHVIHQIKTVLERAKVPHFSDPIGNLIVGVKSKAEYLKKTRVKTQEPLRVFIAHLDHPGFHGLKWEKEDVFSVQWHGGSPTTFLEGAKVWLADKEGSLGHGTFIQPELLPSGRAIQSAKVVVTSLTRRPKNATEIYGGFAFREPVWTEGDLIYTKAADDLVGAFAIVSMAIECFKKKKFFPFIGVLTRAEEVGFIGAIAHFELGWLKGAKRPILGVSLETSRALPGAEIGKGPVVRLGDRYTVFDAKALRVFADLAEKVLPGAHQKRVMDGGSCEATAATIYGHPCVGISVPLGNYHNQSFEGGPDSRGALGPAPEFVHLKDVEGLIQLCHALLRPNLPWSQPWGKRPAEFKKSLIKYRKLLKTGP